MSPERGDVRAAAHAPKGAVSGQHAVNRSILLAKPYGGDGISRIPDSALRISSSSLAAVAPETNRSSSSKRIFCSSPREGEILPRLLSGPLNRDSWARNCRQTPRPSASRYQSHCHSPSSRYCSVAWTSKRLADLSLTWKPAFCNSLVTRSTCSNVGPNRSAKLIRRQILVVVLRVTVTLFPNELA
jgi:hypothetical protein